VKGAEGGVARGWVREAGGQFRSDIDTFTTDLAVRALAASQGPLTYTCVPPGSGTRMGIDRDEDTILDGLDNCPAVANTNQLNADNDSLGDACDPINGPPVGC
jgi:Thrombospondin type 3 repeat